MDTIQQATNQIGNDTALMKPRTQYPKRGVLHAAFTVDLAFEHRERELSVDH